MIQALAFAFLFAGLLGTGILWSGLFWLPPSQGKGKLWN